MKPNLPAHAASFPPHDGALPVAHDVSPHTAREFYIDWLRIGALGLLILYHVGMAYTSWSWHVKSAAAAKVAVAVEPWMRLTSPWRMTLLFVVSGLATSLLLQRRAAARVSAGGSIGSIDSGASGTSGGSGWLRERARRLLLPLVTGMLLLVPPQAYLEVQQFHGYAGSYGDFMRLYFSAYGGFCTPGRGCLALPTWNHLWFLPYLFVYTAVLALVLRRWPSALDAAAARLPVGLHGGALLVLPVAWFALTRWALKPIFGETHALLDDLFLHTQYAAAFTFGVLLARPGAAALWSRLDVWRHAALVFTLASWALLVATPAGPAWRVLPWSVMQWCAVIAALAYARRHLQRDGRARRWLSAAVFPVYVLHQTVTVVAVASLAPAALPAGAEALLLVLLTFGISLLAVAALRFAFTRLPALAVLAPWFGFADAPARRDGTLQRVQTRGVEPQGVETRGAEPQRLETQGAEMRTMAPRVNTYSAPSAPASRSTGAPPTRPKA